MQNVLMYVTLSSLNSYLLHTLFLPVCLSLSVSLSLSLCLLCVSLCLLMYVLAPRRFLITQSEIFLWRRPPPPAAAIHTNTYTNKQIILFGCHFGPHHPHPPLVRHWFFSGIFFLSFLCLFFSASLFFCLFGFPYLFVRPTVFSLSETREINH